MESSSEVLDIELPLVDHVIDHVFHDLWMISVVGKEVHSVRQDVQGLLDCARECMMHDEEVLLVVLAH